MGRDNRIPPFLFLFFFLAYVRVKKFLHLCYLFHNIKNERTHNNWLNGSEIIKNYMIGAVKIKSKFTINK